MSGTDLIIPVPSAQARDGSSEIETSATPASTDAPFPFNNPRADVILQSSDNVRFRVRKAILSEASPVFENMFSLPQTNPDNSALPTVPLAEDSAVIEVLLRLCYPADTQSVDPSNINEAVAWLVAARKYDMERTQRHITRSIGRLVASAPLRAYCLVVRYEIGEDLARAAAKGFLDEPLRTDYSSIDPELKHLSAFAYMKLCNYHHLCSAAAQGAIDRYPAEDPDLKTRCWGRCIKYNIPSHCPVPPRGSSILIVDGVEHGATGWFTELMMHCKMLVKDRPSGKDLAPYATTKKALADASACSYCREYAWDHIQAFLSIVMIQIDKAIAQVGHSVPPLVVQFTVLQVPLEIIG